ncbi:MAG: hypothetical protein HUU41_22920 [Bryobacteraceae bacterium]|nr:hypothetical protein [Bryobacteraceae bacterium]
MEEAGDLWFRQDWKPGIDKVVINLEADELVSGGNECLPTPSIILSWLDSLFHIDGFLNRSIHIPQSYSEEQEDHATNFCYGEHLDFDDVHIDFLERTGERFRIKVTGETSDVESTGHGKMAVEIDTVIRFVDRNSPRVLEPPGRVDGVGEFTQTEWCWECNAQYEGHPVQIRLSTEGNSFERFGSYARSVLRQELIPLETMRRDIETGLPGLKWKFDDFNVDPEFNIKEFFPNTFTITEADDKSDDVHLYVFLTHPASGTDNWILRYANSDCYSLEWIPDR